jgi:uncharacterized membrane protein YcaP (DUF421 family)
MDIVVRVALIYLFLMAALRLVGKREFGELTPFELITLLLIPEMVSKALTGEDYSFTAAMIGVSTLLALVLVTSIMAYRFPRVGRALEGEPAILARGGELVAGTLNRERIAPEEMRIELHKYGLEEIAQVKWAMLEVDGSITIIPTRQPEPMKREGKRLP